MSKTRSETISDTSNAGSIVAPAYAYLRDLQSRSGVWLVLESLTDEMVFPTAEPIGTIPTTVRCSRMNTTAKYVYQNTWNSFMLGITKCNVALQYLTKLEQTEEVKNYVNETLFIRALCMYHLMDCFGHSPCVNIRRPTIPNYLLSWNGNKP